jgi:hypothetical protein
VGFLSFHLYADDRPAEAVVLLTQIAGQLSQQFLTGNDDVLVVEVDAQINTKILIEEIALEIC